MMSKKDYVAIAAAVKKLRSLECTMEQFVTELVIVFKKDNPAFVADKFRDACQPDN